MSEPSSSIAPEEVLTFWKEAGPEKWFAKDAAFDDAFRRQFLAAHEEAAAEQLESWTTSADGALALVLLLDQFPRNCFRGSARMYESDPLARKYADRAILAGFDENVDPNLRLFFYLPFEHSEQLEDQQRSVELHGRIGFVDYARHHQSIIQRFGRFPHRNAILGRTSTPEEEAFLERIS